MSFVIGADIGKYQSKFFCRGNGFVFRSLISPSVDTGNENITLTDQRLLVRFRGNEYFVGKLASDEGGKVYINSTDVNKADEVTLINLLIGLHRIPGNKFTVIISNPFSKNKKDNREKMRDLLLGEHEITVNHIKKRIIIERIGINIEGYPAYYTMNCPQDLNIFDFGSSTVHCLAVRDGEFISIRSHTYEEGMESFGRNDYENIAYSLNQFMQHKWSDGDYPVLLIGGGLTKFKDHIAKYYNDVIIHPEPILATAMGNYVMGVEAYG